MTKKQIAFDKIIDDKQIELFVLTNKNGLKIEITNYGGRVISIKVPNNRGKFDDIVLGYDNIEDYLSGNPYFGAIIGRFGNRIANGEFIIDGVKYQLKINNGKNHLHGGLVGFNDVIWDARQNKNETNSTLELSYLSIDGEENYPGNLNVKVTYSLNNHNELKITYSAETDKTTIVNLTHHSFFNLAGEGNGDIMNHRMMINANKFIPVCKDLIPTGELTELKNTPFDFTDFKKIGLQINDNNEQLKYGNGYDHNWILNKGRNKVSLAANVYEPVSGRQMEVWTDQPGIQFYSGNFLDNSDIGKGRKTYGFRSAFCLETQHFPNSPNQTAFPSTILKPNEKYTHICIYKFSTK